MSGSSSQRPYLRVVSTGDDQPNRAEAASVEGAGREARQPMLFSDASLHTLGFIKAGDLDADKFTSLIREAKPRIIFDLRSIPTYARGTLTRRSVFALFEQHGVAYFDVAGVLGVSGGRDGLLNPALLIDALQVNILRSANKLLGPVFFFVNEDLFFDDYFSAVAKQLPHQDGRGWDIACWPNESVPPERKSERDLVFISHANPQDNEVALWLASRLAASGYQVWTDVTRLLGGEVFWDTIEDAIRNRAAKVIVLLSKAGHQKPGLLDEVNVAVATERAESLERFVIPVRVDDLPFAGIRANLSRKNVINGCDDLAGALRKILQILRDDGVPAKPDAAQATLERIQKTAGTKFSESEWAILFENKIDIVEWPRVIRKFRSGATTHNFSFPTHPISGGVATFEEWDVIAANQGGQVQRAGEAAFDHTGSSNASDLVFADRADARRATASLMKQAWDRACAERGLASFVLANKNVCWFLRTGVPGANRFRFVDHQGTERHKALVGQSPRRRVFWHFAIEARPNATDGSYRLVPHVIFSEDGKMPIASHEKQHALRRGFCRNWWNARWRDLLAATLSFLSEGAEMLVLPVSSRSIIRVSARLKAHQAEHADAATAESAERALLQLTEPKVAVGFDQVSDYPKEGLLLFGPVKFERNPTVIKVGVVGTKEGIELYRAWSRQFNGFQADPTGSRNAMPFPGFEAVFGAKWSVDPVHTIALSRTDLINTILLHDRHQAIFRSSGMYVDRITKAIRQDDVSVDIWFVVIPDEVFVYGRPASRVPTAIAIATPGAMGRHLANRFLNSSPSLFPEDNEEAKIYDRHLDFHHQLKARLLDVQAVTQVLRESSLATITASTTPGDHPEPSELPIDHEPFEADDDYELIEPNTVDLGEPLSADEEDVPGDESNGLFARDEAARAVSVASNRHMQDRASVAWNLSTAAFFKAGGRPWRVANAREGVCYIGLIFKRDPTMRSRQSCCGAQMFLQDSDGLVFKGAMGPWYSPETGQFHVSRAEATKLIKTVLESYAEEHPEPPRELFIHGRTRFNNDEWSGFCDAIELSTTRLVGVRITRSNEYKLFSNGELAVRRGTAIRLTRRLGLLWTTGFVEKLGTYPGRETPNPLRVEIVNDTTRETEVDLVMRDIMMLTKMNFNSCVYADGIPVTMRFADAIGDVLITAKEKKVPPLPFRYYI